MVFRMNLKGRLLRLEAVRSARVNEISAKIRPFLETAMQPGASADIRTRAYQISKILRTIAHRALLRRDEITTAEKLCACFEPAGQGSALPQSKLGQEQSRVH